jgi:hypothetical protein
MSITWPSHGTTSSHRQEDRRRKARCDSRSINPFDHHWTLPSRLEDNPLVWMVSVNGFLMDIRLTPREAQAAAFEKGLIPYIPADRRQHQE